MEKTTIAAIATSPGIGGIGIIRISGEEAFSVVAKIFRPKDAFFDVTNPKPNVIKYGYIYDGNKFSLDTNQVKEVKQDIVANQIKKSRPAIFFLDSEKEE